MALTMATARGTALKMQASMGRCWVLELAWDEHGRIEDGRVLAWCDQPPVASVHGSGVCAEHRALFGPTEGGWSNN